jgi:hypothetical protein
MSEEELEAALARYIDSHVKSKSAHAETVKTVARLVGEICRTEKLLPYQVFSKRRTVRMVELRTVLFCVLVDGGLSYSEIGRLASRNHATVMELVKDKPNRHHRLYTTLRDLFYAE